MKQRILFAALALLLLSACHKENPDPRMEITIEKMQGNGKLTLDGTTSTWNDGDTLRLNGTPVVVERSGDHAYISNTAALSTNRALFPTRLVASGPTSDSITVTLPREYDYRSDGTRQQLTLPLAARATDDNPLHFMHLTGALCFMLTNSTSHPLTIDRITVSSNSYQLSGERNINLGSIGSIGPEAGAGDDLTVAMTFTKQSLVIPASGNANVVLPIAPVGSDNRFTVTITCHYLGDRYVYTQTQGEGIIDRSLDRNEIGYAAMTLGNTSHTALFDGDGTKNYPFLITSVSDFLLMAEAITNNWRCNTPNGYYKNFSYKLTNNLNLSGCTIEPIPLLFNAQFDGNNKAINNLTINSRGDTCALFSNLTSCTLKNLTLNNLTLKHNGNADKLYLSGFCGYIYNSTLQNCDISGLTLSVNGSINEIYFGSLASYVYKNNEFKNCDFYTTTPITLNATTFFYGNLLGRCNNGGDATDLTLSSCTVNTSTISLNSTTGVHYAGGLIGFCVGDLLYLNNCTYQGSLNNLAPTSTNYLATGGLVGRCQKYQSTGILSATNCSVQGSISATSNSDYAFIGAYLGMKMNNLTPTFTSCDKTGITLSLNGNSVSKDVGNQ